MSDTNQKQRLNVQIGPVVYKEISAIAEWTGKSKAQVIRDAIDFKRWASKIERNGGRILVERKAGSGNISEIVNL